MFVLILHHEGMNALPCSEINIINFYIENMMLRSIMSFPVVFDEGLALHARARRVRYAIGREASLDH